MTDLVIRPLTENDTALFTALPDPGLVGRALTGTRYRTLAQGGEYRPEWTWVALRGGEVVARAAWWAGPDDDEPVLLNWFDFADGEQEAGAALLRGSGLYAEYELILPVGWRERPVVRAAGQARIDAATAAGLSVLVERYHYGWTPAHGLPERPGRLDFRPEPNDAVILEVLRRVHTVTLDAHASHATAGSGGVEAAARAELDFLRWCPSPRAWWQLAYTHDGDVVGLHIPARNPRHPIIGFVGVVPEWRGHGYAYDLLAESTWFLAESGAAYIAASTDQGNVPMVRTFARAGYPVVQERVNLI